MNADDDSLFETLRQWRAAGKSAALATVVSTWGSSPRPEGSHLAVDDAGHFVGSVSGRGIEAAVSGSRAQVSAQGGHQGTEVERSRGGGGEAAARGGWIHGGRIHFPAEGNFFGNLIWWGA